ncbi:MAG TPA: NifB/NifX family molybdenum-iron cluster-binding protein [Anaerolineae bacterium]|nr:NifB/NifX family molybdenum-iron cluster-binding protein [Anaerolineae bacterium]
MRIAAITDDGTEISLHFGRAPLYAVFTIEDQEIVKSELRDKMGHQQFVHEEGLVDERGRHGFGPGSQERHSAMADAIKDCDVLLCRGMGWGAFESMKQAGIETVVTDIANIEEAVRSYLEGTIVQRTDLLH